MRKGGKKKGKRGAADAVTGAEKMRKGKRGIEERYHNVFGKKKQVGNPEIK